MAEIQEFPPLTAANRAIELLDALQDRSASSRGYADGCLSNFLREIGYGEVADAWAEAQERIGADLA